MKIVGTSTNLKHRYDYIKIDLNKRCYACGLKLILNGWESIEDYEYKEKFYCKRCKAQVVHGIKLKPHKPRDYKERLTNKCEVCGEPILKRYQVCLEHISQEYKNYIQRRIEDKKIISKAFRKGKLTSIYRRNSIRLTDVSNLAYCSYVNCKNKIPKNKDIMYPLYRHGHNIKMFFCSEECRAKFINLNPTEIYKRLNK